MPLTETIEALRMIDAPSGISGNAFCTLKSSPLTLMPNHLSKCASVICPSGKKFAAAGVGEQDVEPT